MSNQVPIYSQVLPKNHSQRANPRQSSRAFSSLRHDPRTPQPGVGDPGFDPLNHNHGGNFGNVAAAEGHARVEKFARESARRSAREAARADSARLHHQHQRRQPTGGAHVRQAEHRINLRSLSLNESAVNARPQQAYERTPTQEYTSAGRLHLDNRDLPLPHLTRESSSRHYISTGKHQDVLASKDPYGSNKLHLSGVSDVISIVKDFKNFTTRDFATGRDAIYENDGGVRGYVSMRNEVVVPDAGNRVHSVRRSASSHKMAVQGNGNCDRRRFFCREWAFQKLAHCLEQRPVSKTCGALILGDAGSGKTALCRELAQPGSGPTARQQRALQRRMIARHFLQGQNENSLTMGEFIRTLVMQILSHSTHHRHSSSSSLLLNAKESNNPTADAIAGTCTDAQGIFTPKATPSAPPLEQIDPLLNPGESISESGQRSRRPRHSTMERIHERDHYDDLMTHIPDAVQTQPPKEEESLDSTRPPPRGANTNPFLPNFQRADERQTQLYENHENVFLRNASQHPKDSRNSRLYRQQSEPPMADKKTAVLQKSLSTDSKNNIAISIAIDTRNNISSAILRSDVNVSDNSDCGNKSSDCSKNESVDGIKTPSMKKETVIDNSFNSPALSPSSNTVTNSSKVSRIPVASFKYPNMSALSSAENSPSKNRITRDNFERNSASDNSDNTRESSGSKSNKETCNKQPVIVSNVDNSAEENNTETAVVPEDELPEYQNVLKPPNCPKELSPKINRLEQFNLGEFVRLDETVLNSPDYDPNPFDVRKLLSVDNKKSNGKIDAISPSRINAEGDDVPPPIPSLPVNPRTLIANYYYEKLLSEPEIQQALLPHNLEKNPDDCFKKALLFPLLEIDPPKQCLFLLVDSIDESPLMGSSVTNSTLTKDRDKNGSDCGNLAMGGANSSKSIAELLANHHHLFPQWLLLVCTARKQSKYLTKMFTGFRKISLDDLRKNHVTLDVQRYILARLDGEARLRQHVSRDAAQALDHLRIKSNGCFLYLERVLDGLADGSVALREIREIPGTLNGLYLWLCQRLFHGRKFAKVQPLLNVLLAAKCGVDAEMLHKCLLTTNYTISREEFNKRLHLLKRILTADAASGTLSIFHHSFSEWLLDVKHCTRRFLCNATSGHASLAMYYTLKGKSLTVQEIHALVTHMTRVEAGRKANRDRDSKSIDISTNQDQLQLTSTTSLETSQNSSDRLLSSSSPSSSPVDFHTLMLLWILDCGCPVETSLRSRPPVLPTAASNATIGGLTVANGAPSESGSSGADTSIGRSPRDESINRHSSTHSLGGTSTTALTAPSWTIPEFLSGFYCPTLPRESRVLRALLEMGARTTDSVSSPPRPNTPNALQHQVTASQISLEHLLMLEAEEEAALEELAEQSSRTQEEALSLFTLDPLTGRAPVHMLAQTGDTITLAQALQAYVAAGGAPESIETADRAGQTALQLAARGGRREAVSLLLERGATADRADSEGWTPLRAAAWGGHTEVVELLLKHGCEVDCVDSDHRTALRAAAWSGHEEIVRLLLSHGADVNKTDLEGRTALIAAAYMGHTDIVNHLLDHGAHIDHADSDGRTALAVAALCSSGGGGGGGGGGCAQLLLERGAAPATPDKDGMTPLLVAAFEGHREVIELLLEAEADPEASDKAGRTPLWAAAAAGHAPAVRTLLFWGCCVDTIDQDGRTVLSVAAAQGSVEVVRQLVDRGLDEHHRDNAGWTPLHFAAFEGHLEVCDVLLEAGAKVDETDNDGKAPLMLAAQEGHCRLMELLIDEWAAPVDQHSHDGKTALRVAALEGHYEAVRILVERGACVDAVDADQRSTLYILALDNRISMAKYLMHRAGANVETRDSEGRTPLHVSAWQGHYEMVNLLLTVGGSSIDALDGERRTPLHSASWRGQAAVVRLLLSKGANPHAQCDQGATPLGIASQEGHEECVLWLLQHGANPKHSDHCGRTPAKVALRAGHLHVCRLLERWGATPSNQQIITNISSQPDQSGGTNTSGSTAETKACTASLGNARLSPLPAVPHNQGSPDSKRRSVHSSNSTKSSSNLTSSTVSSSQQDVPPVPPPHSRAPLPMSDSHQQNGPPNGAGLALSFAQQVARCGRRGGGGVTSPLYATPPHSPLSDVCSPTQPLHPHSASGLGILSSIAHQFGSGQQAPQEQRGPVAADANSTDRHFCRDTHMRIILGRENKHSPPTAGEHASRETRDRDRDREGSRMSCRKLVGSIGKIARRRKTSSPVVGGKTKRNGIVTNPAMRLVANVRNGLDTAAANIRRTGVALAASASSNNPAVKTNAFQWKRETPL